MTKLTKNICEAVIENIIFGFLLFNTWIKNLIYIFEEISDICTLH